VVFLVYSIEVLEKGKQGVIGRKNDWPLVVSEHIKNKRSKHQYENLSLGASFPISVVPKFEYFSSMSTGMICAAGLRGEDTEFDDVEEVEDELPFKGMDEDSPSTLHT
jgi:hypothetical protein